MPFLSASQDTAYCMFLQCNFFKVSFKKEGEVLLLAELAGASHVLGWPAYMACFFAVRFASRAFVRPFVLVMSVCVSVVSASGVSARFG